MLISKIKEFYVEFLLLTILLVVSSFLRFPNLGYSDYIGDEHKSFIELGKDQTLFNFFMEQRKGPMQFLVSYIPYSFTGDFRNELAQRIPFTIFGLASIFVFYFFVKKIANNKWIAFVASFLLSTDGFIIGFSRISQYQNLNLFFSFAALYFYADFLKPNKNLLRNTIFGTICFSLSILSHWDAIFVLIPILYFLIVFLKNDSITKEEKVKVISKNFLFGSLILLPFLIPYVRYQFLLSQNQEYFQRRVEFGNYDIERYHYLFNLYNPFLVKEFLLLFAGVSIIFIRKNYPYVLWFLVNFGIFAFFVRKPGTHVYNFVIPLIILSSYGLVLLVQKLPKILKGLIVLPTIVFFSFFVYQAHAIFIDHTVEYPWRQESLFENICEDKYNAKGEPTDCGKFVEYFRTPEYRYDDKAPLFGFPLYRHWNEINDYINNQNNMNNEDFGYITNEVKTISEWYMDTDYQGEGNFYVVGIKYPLSFVNDWKFVQIGGKEKVKEFENNGEEVVRIYRVEKSDE